MTVPATFTARPNRFVVEARLEDGVTLAHLADPGRLVELLVPGAELRLRPAPAGSRRRTRFSVALVRAGRENNAPWVSLEPARANRWVAERLSAGSVPELAGDVEAEVRRGASRFDFRIRGERNTPTWVEVKAVSWAAGGIGRFPDAPTVRGLKHVQELTEIAVAGERACLILAAMRHDVREIRPFRAIDPDWADAVVRASRSGVRILGMGFAFDERAVAQFRAMLPFRANDPQAAAAH